MIVVDTSALMALFLEEPEASAFAAAIMTGRPALLAAPSAFEFRLAAIRKLGRAGAAEADALVDKLPLTVAAWTAEHVPLAKEALIRFGGRPARLNFGDCMAYALAKSLDAPLLYKGEDFARTDVKSALRIS